METSGRRRRRPTLTGQEEREELSVRRVIVDDLFGQYSYVLPQPTSDVDDVSKVFLLYGENGSGKTTILKLIFHLLSAEGRKGHRSRVAQVPFRRFALELSDGHVISAERDHQSIEGNYTWLVQKNTKTVASVECHVDASMRVKPGDNDEEPYTRVLSAIKHLGLAVYYLSDDRTLVGDSIDQSRLRTRQFLARQSHMTDLESTAQMLMTDYGRTLELQDAVERVSNWARNQALLGSNRGQTSSNSVYIDLVRRIATSQDFNESEAPDTVAELQTRIQLLAERSGSFARFRLAPAMPAAELLDLIQRSTHAKYLLLSQILRPYLDGVEARLAALQELHDTVEVFVESLNSFFVGKRVQFDLARGLTIESARGKSLDPAMLSSGERHLLILFCNIP